MKKKRRILAAFVSLALLISTLALPVSAEGSDSGETKVVYGSGYLYANGIPIYVKEDGIYTAEENEGVYTAGDKIIVYQAADSNVAMNDDEVKAIITFTLNVYAGSNETAIEGDTLVVLGGTVSINQVLGGGKGSASSVTGVCEVIVQDSARCKNVYGGGTYGSSGSTKITIDTAATTGFTSVNGGGYGDDVLGNADVYIKANGGTITALYVGGRGSGASVGGDMTLRIANTSFAKNVIGGCEFSAVSGDISISVEAGTAFSALFYPLGKTIASTSTPSVEGVATLNLPSAFDLASLGNVSASKEEDITINLVENGDIINTFTYDVFTAPDAPEGTKITTDGSGTYFVNGVNATVKADSNGNVYFLNKFGTKLDIYNESDLNTAINDYSIETNAIIYCGSNNQEYGDSTKITLDGVTVDTVYGAGSGENGGVTGNTSIVLKNASADYIYGGSDNSLSTASVKSVIMLKGTSSVEEHIYPCGIPNQRGSCSSSEIIVPIEEEKKIDKYINDYINFFSPSDINTIIQADVSYQASITINGSVMGTGVAPVFPSGTAPSAVTSDTVGSELYVYLNGIPAVIQGDSEGTYLYDEDGINKIYNDPIDDARVFGGSKGTVVASTSIVMESGTVSYIYGGGYGGEVGTGIITVNDGTISNSLYGGGKNNGSNLAVINNIEVVVNGASAKAINASDDGITGNAVFTMNGGIYQGLYAGNKSSVFSPVFNTVTEDVSFTVNGGTFTALYGGSSAGIVQGNSTLYINGGFMSSSSSSNIYPLGKTSAGSDVLGTATVYHYKGFDTSWIQNQDSENVTIVETDKESSTIDLLAGYVQNKDAMLSTTNDNGNLVFRFFEMMLSSESRDTVTRTVAGNCILITFPNGENMLVDAGTAGAATSVIADLQAMGIDRLDYISISHYHDDHVGGFPAILAAFEVGEIWLPPYEMDETLAPTTYNYYETSLNAITTYNDNHEPDAVVKNVSEGDIINIGEGEELATITVLHPADDIEATDLYDHATINGASVVFRVEYKDTSALMTADIFVTEEAELIANYPDLIDVDLLLAPHHAYTTSNSTAFIQATSPEAAVAMHLQQYNAPQLTVGSRYTNAGVDFYQTAVYGMVKATLDGEKVSMVTEWSLAENPEASEPKENTTEEKETEEKSKPVSVTKDGVTASTVKAESYGSDTHNKALISKTVLNQAIRSTISAAVATGTTPQVVIQVETTTQAKETQVSLPVTSLKKLAESTVETLRISSGLAAIDFTRDALSGIASQATYDSIRIISAVADYEALADEVKAQIGSASVYEFSIMNGTAPISSFGGGKATVTIPYTLKDGENAENIIIWYIGSVGTLQKVEGAKYYEKSQTVVFETTHFSTYAVTAAPVKVSQAQNTESQDNIPIPDTGSHTQPAVVFLLLISAAGVLKMLILKNAKTFR